MKPYKTLWGRWLAAMSLLVTVAGAYAQPGRGNGGQ
jgi:hypothetical protein